MRNALYGAPIVVVAGGLDVSGYKSVSHERIVSMPFDLENKIPFRSVYPKQMKIFG
jgi:hypothetical protein